MKKRTSALVFSALALALGAVLASCSGKPAAGLVVSIQTDVPLPKDVDDVRLEILTYGSLQFGNDYAVGAGQLLIPATMTLLPGTNPGTPATIRLLARQNGKLRMLRETVTTIPTSRVASLRMPIQWLCTGSGVETSPGVVQSTCPGGQTCDNGSCVSTNTDSSALPEYQPELVFGGGSSAATGKCFDLLACFASGTVTTVDTNDCSIDDPGGDVNVALSLATSLGDGQCGPKGCLVPVRQGGTGWLRSNGRIKLPSEVCVRAADKRVTSVLVSTSCATATADTPLCGSWSGMSSSGSGTDGGTQDATVPPCVGLKCQQVACGGGAKTTVTGTVYDPAGKNPLYNVVVYVPNAPLAPIAHGPVCDSCSGASVSGSPVVTALTDATGKFVLENVPVGTNIPLVMQAGKWRRTIVVPKVTACADNPVGQKPAGIENLTRLPKNQSEGDMPLIALTAGCDTLHTLVQKIGIDPSEITSENGTGTVQVFAGSGGQNGGIAGATDAYAFWGTKAKMMKYDIIINECECVPNLRSTVGPAYTNMKDYLSAGGRVFASHYQLNFFSADPNNPTGTPDPMLSSAATWTLWGGSPTSSPHLIDTSFPKGKAMDDWLHNLKTASGWGASLAITSPNGQFAATTPPAGDIGAATAGISQRWIYPQAGGSVSYISLNMPTNVPANQRCGRAVGADLHATNASATTMIEQEAALEFMFFDLASCVIDDATAPTPPPPAN